MDFLSSYMAQTCWKQKEIFAQKTVLEAGNDVTLQGGLETYLPRDIPW